MTQRRRFMAAALGAFGLGRARAQDSAPAAGAAEATTPDILFTQRDTVVDFQPGTGLGLQVGTVAGKINGTVITNFQFTPLSQTEIRFDNRVLITDIDGEQILFRHTGNGRFIQPLTENSALGSLMGTGGPLAGTYECTQASGKWSFLVGRKFGYKSVAVNPARPGYPGQVYVEVYTDRFDGQLL